MDGQTLGQSSDGSSESRFHEAMEEWRVTQELFRLLATCLSNFGYPWAHG